MIPADSTLAQTPILTFYDQGRFGYSVAGAGDVNGDGYPDIIAGAFQYYMTGQSDIGMASVFSGKDGRRLYFLPGHKKAEYFGISVDGAGDVNRDGHGDFVVGAHGNDKNGYEAGAVYVYSGKDGTVLHSFFGLQFRDALGYNVSGVGDVNRDGYSDILASGHGGGVRPGIAAVFSGKDGKMLFGARGTVTNDYSGVSCDAGDVNLDGYPDFVLSGRNSVTSMDTAQVVSGKNFGVLYTFAGPGGFNDSISAAGDVNRDGHPDIIAGRSGNARIFSGKDGKLLRQLSVDGSVSGAGDINQDGYADVVVGMDGNDVKGWLAGAAFGFSGKDGSVLFRAYGDKAGDQFGVAVDHVGDVNRDGISDVVVGAWRDAGGPFPAFARVISGKKLSLSTATNSLSISAGGNCALNLDAGVPNQLKTYLVLGSLSGTAPGLKLGNLAVPLNADSYLLLTLQYPNTVISESFGVLEWYGRSTAMFNLPKGLPTTLVGTIIHHAFIAADLRKPPYVVDLASNAVIIRLEQ